MRMPSTSTSIGSNPASDCVMTLNPLGVRRAHGVPHSSLPAGSSEPDDHLSAVLAAHQGEEGVQGVVEAVHDGLLVVQLAREDPAADLADELRLQVHLFGDHE